MQIFRWQALAPDHSDRYPFYLTKPWLQSVSTAAKARNKGQNVNFKRTNNDITYSNIISCPFLKKKKSTCINLPTQIKTKKRLTLCPKLPKLYDFKNVLTFVPSELTAFPPWLSSLSGTPTTSLQPFRKSRPLLLNSSLTHTISFESPIQFITSSSRIFTF